MALWRAVKLLLTLRCDQSTRLLSDSYERELTGVERWAVRLHQISCGYCRQVAKQFRLVHEAAGRAVERSAGLSPDARARIAAGIAHRDADSDNGPDDAIQA